MIVAPHERTLSLRRGPRPMIAVLLAALALIPVMHIAVIVHPLLDPTLGIFSTALSVVTGAAVVTLVALAFVVITVVAPPGPWDLPVDQLANRLVYGSLFAVRALVETISALIEQAQHGAGRATDPGSPARPREEHR